MDCYRCTVFSIYYHCLSAFLGRVTVRMADLSVIRTFNGCMHFHMIFQGGMLVFKKKRFKISAEGTNFEKHFYNFYSHFGLWAVTGILLSRPLIISFACFLFTWLCTTTCSTFSWSASACPGSLAGSFVAWAEGFRSWCLCSSVSSMGVDGPVSGRVMGSEWPLGKTKNFPLVEVVSWNKIELKLNVILAPDWIAKVIEVYSLPTILVNWPVDK